MMMSDLDDDDNDKEEGTCEHQQDSPFIQQERLIFDSTPFQPFFPPTGTRSSHSKCR
jgi:hypothetical protein